MKKAQKTLLIVGRAIVVLAAALAMSGCFNADAETEEQSIAIRPVKAMQLTKAANSQIFEFPATAKAAREVKVSFQVGGPLVRLDVETGQKVEKDQLIALIDKRDFKIAVQTLKARLLASQAQLEEANLQYKRHKKLLKMNAVAKSQYDSAKAAFRMLSAQVKADAENLKATQNALTDTRLEAPFSGYVHQKFVENHETVAPGQAVISLVDLSTMEVEFGLPENLVGRVPEFNSFQVSFDAVSGKVFSAVLKEIGKKPDPTTRTYPMTIVLKKDAGDAVRPGMTAEVKIKLASREKHAHFIVPIQALFNHGGSNSCVWILDQEKGQVHRQAVMVGQLTPAGVEISGQLTPGQWVVTAGTHNLQEGMKVRLLPKTSQTNVGGML